MTKFKVGDRVKVIAIVTGARGARIGDIGTIKVVSGTYLKYAVEFDNPSTEYHNAGGYCKECHGYWCSDEMLELAKPETIVIYRKDNKVIALDKSTGKKATARCNPADKFDFTTGSKLAFARLTGEDKPQVKEVHRTAHAGEYVKIIAAVCVPVNDDGTPAYKNGDIIEIINNNDIFHRARFRNGKDKHGKECILFDEEYVVLEGYKPEEPKYYNGKIIFTKGDDVFKTGHIYEVKNGIIHTGRFTVPSVSPRFKNFDDVKEYFSGVPEYSWSLDKLDLIEVVE